MSSKIKPYKKNGVVRDRPPKITEVEISKQIEKLIANEFIVTSGFLKIVDNADVDEYATYDIRNGQIVEYMSEGYFVSFQVNKAIGVHRDYEEREYDLYVYECMARTDSLPYLGYYGNAEISFHAKSLQTAISIAVDFNQKSVYDIKNGIERFNEYYNKNTNPTED